MYEVIANDTTIARDLESDAAFALAEQYLQDHNGENVTLLVRRQKD